MAPKEVRQAAALREDDDSLKSPGPEGAVRDHGSHASGGGGQHRAGAIYSLSRNGNQQTVTGSL
jgi:hypothetical protein